MINITAGTPDNLVIAVGHGKITGQDYEHNLIPAIEAVLKTHRKVRLLYQLGEDFHGFSAGAIWDDSKLGFRHHAEFEAVAVVTNVTWIKDTVKLFAFFMRCPVKVFSNEEFDQARDWVATVPAWLSVSEVPL
jgi:hypothetical protein